MRYVALLVFLALAGCSVDECSDRTRSDLDYCNCYPKNCQPSDYEPIDWENL